MARPLRFIPRLLLLAIVSAVVYWLFSRRTGSAPTGAAPTTFAPAAAPAPETAPAVKTSPSSPPWVATVDGVCPDGYPIKVNASSGIYHVPGGRFYGRTVAERCYATEAAAEADGYRRAKA